MAERRIKLTILMFIGLYLLLVVVLPSWVYPNLPLDTVEHIGWGKQWQWGYPKWPYVSGWLAAFIAGMSHPHAWGLYALSALCVLVAFCYAYAYVRDAMGSAMARYACFLSALLYVFYITTLEYNVNLPLLPFYAAFIYYFFKAVTYQQYRHWLLVGVLVGFGAMTKYTMVLYVLPACLMLLFNRQGRCSWRYLGMYLALLLALVICLPNIWWLSQHGWIAFDYAIHRSDHMNVGKYPFLQQWSYLSHLFNPLKLLLAFIVMTLPACLVFFVRQRGRVSWLPMQSVQDVWCRAVPLAPVMLMVVVAFSGSNVRSAYLLPLVVWVGPTLVLCLQAKPLQGKVWPVFLAVCMVCYGGGYALVGYGKVHYRQRKLTRPFFMGKELGLAAETFWKQQAGNRPLVYVIGDTMWQVANMGFYAPSYPQSLFDIADIQREHQSIMHAGALVVLPVGAPVAPWQGRLAPLKLQAIKKVTVTRGSHVLSVNMMVFL